MLFFQVIFSVKFLFSFLSVPEPIKKMLPWIFTPKSQACEQLEAFMKPKVVIRDVLSHSGRVYAAAATLGELQTQEIQHVMLASLTFSLKIGKTYASVVLCSSVLRLERASDTGQPRAGPAVCAEPKVKVQADPFHGLTILPAF